MVSHEATTKTHDLPTTDEEPAREEWCELPVEGDVEQACGREAPFELPKKIAFLPHDVLQETAKVRPGTNGRHARRSQERQGGDGMDLIRLVASILIPPLGVFLQVGLGWQFLLNVLLTALGYFPGLIHAAWIIFSRR